MTPGEPSSISRSLILSLFLNTYGDLGPRESELGPTLDSSSLTGYFQPSGKAGVEVTAC